MFQILIYAISAYLLVGIITANKWAQPLYNYFEIKKTLQPGTDLRIIWWVCALLWFLVLISLYLDSDGVGIRQGDYD